MICNDLWGFSIDHPYFGYNSAEQENLFCVFLRFRNLSKLKLTWEPSRVQEVNEGGHNGQTSTCGAGPGQATPPMLKNGPRASDAIHFIS
jgi:hypothetical protein